jgi:N utilization substance protein B
MSGPDDERRRARLAAVQALYQVAFGEGRGARAVVDEFLLHRCQDDALDRGRFRALVEGTAIRRAELDGVIAGHLAPGWTLARLDPVVLAILRAGAFELLSSREVPARVVLDEYVSIARAFFGGKEPGFVNGLLDRLARHAREEEFTDHVAPAAPSG